MPVLIATTAVLGVLVLVDLALTAAVVRRLREHEERLSAPGRGIDVGGPPLGAPLPPLDGATTGPRPTLVGFFSSSCSACVSQAPAFAQRAGELAADGVRVVAVLTVRDGQADETLREALGRHAMLVVEGGDGPLTTAVSPHATPSYFYYDGTDRLAAKDLSIEGCLKAAS